MEGREGKERCEKTVKMEEVKEVCIICLRRSIHLLRKSFVMNFYSIVKAHSGLILL